MVVDSLGLLPDGVHCRWAHLPAGVGEVIGTEEHSTVLLVQGGASVFATAVAEHGKGRTDTTRTGRW